jgi:hypothetical protein
MTSLATKQRLLQEPLEASAELSRKPLRTQEPRCDPLRPAKGRSRLKASGKDLHGPLQECLDAVASV